MMVFAHIILNLRVHMKNISIENRLTQKNTQLIILNYILGLKEKQKHFYKIEFHLEKERYRKQI